MAAGITLVLGATGKTGRRIVSQLAARDLPVRIGSRSAPIPFDWSDRGGWAAALRGVDAVYISYFPDLAVEGASEDIRALTALAAKTGVSRLVLLSGRGEAEAQACERIVQASGLAWTVLRCSWFAQNFSESHLLEPILAGTVALPAGDVGEPFVDTDDIADVAVAALTDDRHVGQLYELTGPRLWSFKEAVAEIGRVISRDIRYERISNDDYAAALRDAQVPPEVVKLISYLFGEVLDGRNAFVTDGVFRALGRAPRDFAQYVRDTAATGVWSVQ
jgi:uncharacterized protein YbjT (DUF2867 family)